MKGTSSPKGRTKYLKPVKGIREEIEPMSKSSLKGITYTPVCRY